MPNTRSTDTSRTVNALRPPPRRRRRSAQEQGMGQEGIGIDSYGGPVIDPTENVKDLMEASIRALTDQSDLRAQLVDEKIRRMEREVINADRLAVIRAEHSRELRVLESDRLDKIRQVDVLNASTAADRAAEAIRTLASQQASQAETLRAQVAMAASSAESRLAGLFGDSNKRLSALELSFSEGRGKQAVADPQIERLSVMVENLVRSRATDTGKSEGISASWGMLLAVFGLIATMVSIGAAAVTLIIFLNRSPTANSPIYVPAPQGTVLPASPPGTVPQ